MKHYELNSAGTFKALPAGVCRRLLKSLPTNLERGIQSGAAVRVGNEVYKIDFVSYSSRYESLSIYWVSRDGTKLIRISDHWCGSTAAHHQLTWCSRIASCNWRIDGSCQPVDGALTIEHHYKDIYMYYGEIRSYMQIDRWQWAGKLVAGKIKLAALKWR